MLKEEKRKDEWCKKYKSESEGKKKERTSGVRNTRVSLKEERKEGTQSEWCKKYKSECRGCRRKQERKEYKVSGVRNTRVSAW
jgi:hypothetical protein